MRIVVPLTAIKADGKTRLEFKGVRSQLENLTPKILCIEFPGKKGIISWKVIYAYAWTTCQGMEDYIREVVTSAVALLPLGKPAFT